MSDVVYDIIIVGAGPSGINCAIEASRNGLSYLVLEKGVLTNSIFNFPLNMTFFSTSVKLEIGGVPFISHNEKATRSEALEYYRRVMDRFDLNIQFKEMVTDIGRHQKGFNIATTKGSYTSRFVVVATGFFDQPNLMNVKGEELPKVKHYYDEVHRYIRQKVLVVGGANSACDVALELWQKGAEVTMAVREDALYEKVKYWILPNIQNRIAEGSIKAYFNTTVKEITEDKVYLITPEGEIELDNDYVLAMTGYKPNYSFLEKIGVEIRDDDKRTPVYKEHSLESNVSGLYLCGVILGGLHTSKYFIENTRDQGEKIIKDILLKTALV